MNEDVQADDHLAQIATAHERASKPTVDRSTRQTNKQSIKFDFRDLKEQLKQPTVAVLFAVNALLAMALVLTANHFSAQLAIASAQNASANAATATQAALATGVANQAERQAQNAEREARVAMDKAEELRIQTEALKVIQAYTKR